MDFVMGNHTAKGLIQDLIQVKDFAPDVAKL